MFQPFHLEKTSPFPPGTGPNCSKLLDQLSTKASWSISCSNPIFFYLCAFTSFRVKVISSNVQRNPVLKKIHPYESRVVVLQVSSLNTENKPQSKLPASCHNFSQNKIPLLKKRGGGKAPIPKTTILFWRLKTCSEEIGNLTGPPSDTTSDKVEQRLRQIPA